MYSHLPLNGGRFLDGDQHSYPLFFMHCVCNVTVTLPVTIIWYETLVVFVSSRGFDYLITFYRNLFDMCYSMDNEQDENEQKKVRLKTFINCIFIVGQDVFKRRGCYYLFVHCCIFPPIFFYYSAIHTLLLVSQWPLFRIQYALQHFKTMVAWHVIVEYLVLCGVYEPQLKKRFPPVIRDK